MNKVETIIWILAYSTTITNLLVGFICYSRTKDKRIASFLLLIINLLLITLISIGFSIDLLQQRIFEVLLFTSLLALFFTIPRLSFLMEEILFPRKIYLTATALIYCLAIILYVTKQQFTPLIYTVWWIPFLLMGFHLNKRAKDTEKVSEQKAERVRIRDYAINLKAAWYLTGYITIIMSLTVLILIFTPLRSTGIYFSVFGFFYCLYNYPSLHFFIHTLIKNQNDQPGNIPVNNNLEKLLSPRELEVAEKLIAGKKYREISDELFISLSTVKKHSNNIYRKTGMKNGRQLIQFALKVENQFQ